MAVNVVLRQGRERVVAECPVEHREVVAQRSRQARTVSLDVQVVTAAQLVGLPGSEQLTGGRRTQNGLLETLLQFGERAHAACLRSLRVLPASARATSSSSINSLKGGILSSRSIIVGTGPSRCKVCA